MTGTAGHYLAGRSLAQKLPFWLRQGLFGLVKPIRGQRRHLYCIGLPKTGTHSVAGLFQAGFHSAHEPRFMQLSKPLQDLAGGQLDEFGFERLMRDRRSRLWLDMESCHILGQFASRLARIFPNARFIMPVREPQAWLDSMIDDQFFHLNDPRYRPWWPIYDCYFGPRPHSFADEERELSEANLYSLKSYLNYYRKTQQDILSSIPGHRLLVLETGQIANRLSDIATFSGVDVECLDNQKSHSYQRPSRSGILSRIEPEHLSACIQQTLGHFADELAQRAQVKW